MQQPVNNKPLKGVSYAKYGYLFSIPFVLTYLVFHLYPILYTAVIGFTDLKGAATTTFKFLEEPFENFSKVLSNKTFITSIGNTFVLWIMNFIPQLGLALLITAWFTNRRYKVAGQGFFKVMFYMPNIITSATIAILFATIFGYPNGPANDLLKSLGIVSESFNFPASKEASKLVVSYIQFWTWYGYTAIILMSGVLGINPELFEAAEIDGAKPSQVFFRITIPCIRTILIFTLITSLIGGLNMFDIPKLYIQDGGPDKATITASVFIYIQAFTGQYRYNLAAAASMILFVIIVVLSVVTFYLMRDRYESKQKRIERTAVKAAKHSDNVKKEARIC